MWRDPDGGAGRPGGTLHSGPTSERWTERVIREAQERGEFDDLPHRGERLPVQDETYAGDMALAYHVLKNAGVAPPWIEADRELRRILQDREALLQRAALASPLAAPGYRRQLRDLVAAANRAIATINADGPPSVHRRLLDPTAETAELERRLGRRPGEQ
jgi:DnaJ homolog subfamily C member 28